MERIPFRFFRHREARLYDEETFHDPEQGEIDAACGDPPNRWTDVNLSLLKYIDDFNGVEKLYKKSAVLTLSEKNVASVRAFKSEILYGQVSARARTIGMKVNERKTQMLCIFPSGDSNISTYIYIPEGQRIESGESLKILGFYIRMSFEWKLSAGKNNIFI